MKDSYLNVATRIALAFITLFVVMVSYWQYQPSKVLTVDQPLKVTSVVDSKFVLLSATYCKNVRSTGTIRISFVSTTLEVFSPMAAESMPTGCHKDQQLPVLIPAALPAGTYYIKFNATYKVNPIKTFNVIFKTEQFKVG